MTGLVRRATLLTAVGLLAASAAMAGVPSASTSTLGTSIRLAAHAGGVTEPLAVKTIIVRDGTNNPVPNSVVIINFTNCTPGTDMRICATQQAGNTVNCAAKTVSATTDASGVATFKVVGGARNTGTPANPPGVSVAGCASVAADGVPLGTLTVSAPDEDGVGGMTVTDTAAYFGDRLPPATYRSRSDLDGDNDVDVTDTAHFFNHRFSSGSAGSCATMPASAGYCAGM